MQAIIQLIIAVLSAIYRNPKKSIAAGGAGAGALTMGLYSSSVTYPPAVAHQGNTANYPGSDGQAIVSDGDGTFTIEDVVGGGGLAGVTNNDSATDGQLLASNGDETSTFETISIPVNIQDLGDNGAFADGEIASWDDMAGEFVGVAAGGVDATGVTDGWVYTADGADGADFEAPAVGGLLTPDSITTITNAAEFNVRDYGASGSRRMFYGTSTAGTYTTKDSAGTPTDHDFAVGHGVLLLESGAVCDCSTPVITGTHAGITNEGTSGATTYGYKFVAFDADGAYTAASAELQTTTGNATLSATNFNRIKIPIPRHAVSVAIYGRGTSNWKLLQHFDVSDRWRNDGEDMIRVAFTLANNSGSIRLTVPEGHGIQIGDYIQIKTTTTGDEVYDVEAEVTGDGGGSTTILDCSGVAYDGTATTASGYLQAAHVEWDDKGDAVPLHAIQYIPDQEGPPKRWRAGVSYALGDWIADPTSGRIYRVVHAIGTRRSGTVEPTWSAGMTQTMKDNELVWMQELAFIPVDPPGSAVRKHHFTTIATVPTSSTFTITDAAGTEIGSNKQLIAHNDALAFRNCLAAVRTYGQAATIKIPGGFHRITLPNLADTTYWTRTETAFTRSVSFLPLISGTQDIAFPNISIVADPSATIAVRQCQQGGIVENLNSFTNHDHEDLVGIIKLGLDDVTIQGGSWEWAPYAGGIAEIDNSAFNSRTCWVIDSTSSSSSNLSAVPQGATLRDVTVHFPKTWETVGQSTAESNSYRNMRWYGCRIYYGAGDGDTLYAKGGLRFVDGHIEQVRRNASHGLYLGIGQDDFKITGSTFRHCGLTDGKFAIQVRGQGGDSWATNVLIDGNTFINCGQVLVGDITSSNRTHKTVISNCLGTGVSVSVAECRGLSISGGDYSTIQVREDCQDISISNLTCDRIDAEASDTHKKVKITNVNFRQRIDVGNTTELLVAGCDCLNPYTKGTVLVSGVYEWVATGSNDEYYVRLRATGGDPGISSPTGVLVRDVQSIVAGTLGSLGNDAWFYGYPDGLAGAGIAYQTIVVKIGDSLRYNPDANPYGTVRTITVASGGIGLLLGGTLTNATFRDINLRSTWDNTAPMVLGSANTLRGVKFINILTEYAGTPVGDSDTLYCWDFGSTDLPLVEEVVIEGCEWLGNNTDNAHRDIRMPMGRGGNLTLRNCKMKMWRSNPDFGTCFGSVHVEGCEIQTNEVLVTASTANTFTPVEGYRSSMASTGAPVVLEQGPSTAFPTASGLTAGLVVFLNGSDLKLYPTAADAAAQTNVFDVTAVGTGPCLMRQLRGTTSTMQSNNEFLGDASTSDVIGHVNNNIFRGAKSRTYAQITSNQSNYQLVMLVNTHRLSSNASREIDGFNAPGGGTVHGRRDRLINVGAQDIVLKDDTDTGSVAQNRIACHTNADITISAGESIEIEYDAIDQVWRTISYTASWELKSDILPLHRVALWAIEPKRIQLALGA